MIHCRSHWFVLLFLPDETPDGSGFCGDGDDKKGLWGVVDVVLNNSPIILGKLLFACFSANANKLLFDSFDASARSEKLDISARDKFVFKISVFFIGVHAGLASFPFLNSDYLSGDVVVLPEFVFFRDEHMLSCSNIK